MLAIFIPIFLIYLCCTLCFEWAKAGPCGDWFNPLFTLVMIYLIYVQLGQIKEDGECKIIFDLIEKYENYDLNDAIKTYWDNFRSDFFKKDLEKFKNEYAKQDDLAKRQQYRKILYFWKKVAVAYKQKYIGFNALISAFPSMDTLELFYPVHELVCQTLDPPHEPDVNILALRDAYRNYTVRRMMEKDNISKEDARNKYKARFANQITWN